MNNVVVQKVHTAQVDTWIKGRSKTRLWRDHKEGNEMIVSSIK